MTVVIPLDIDGRLLRQYLDPPPQKKYLKHRFFGGYLDVYWDSSMVLSKSPLRLHLRFFSQELGLQGLASEEKVGSRMDGWMFFLVPFTEFDTL